MFAGPRALSRTLQSQERVAERALRFLVDRKQREEKGGEISVTQESYDQLSAQYNPREDALLTNFTTTKPHVLKFPEPSKMTAQVGTKPIQQEPVFQIQTTEAEITVVDFREPVGQPA